jgi:hypothetical protein
MSASECNWQSLHAQIQEYRIQHGATIMQFLRLCNLQDHRAYFQQLCSRKGAHLKPSSKIGSAGSCFTIAVTSFFDSLEQERERSQSEDLTSSASSTSSVEEIICDLRFDGDELNKLGIQNIDVAGDNPNKLIVCHLQNFDRDAVKQYLMNKLSGASDSSGLEFDFRLMTLLFATSMW